jgi:hypothetical protein
LKRRFLLGRRAEKGGKRKRSQFERWRCVKGRSRVRERGGVPSASSGDHGDTPERREKSEGERQTSTKEEREKRRTQG